MFEVQPGTVGFEIVTWIGRSWSWLILAIVVAEELVRRTTMLREAWGPVALELTVSAALTYFWLIYGVLRLLMGWGLEGRVAFVLAAVLQLSGMALVGISEARWGGHRRQRTA